MCLKIYSTLWRNHIEITHLLQARFNMFSHCLAVEQWLELRGCPIFPSDSGALEVDLRSHASAEVIF